MKNKAIFILITLSIFFFFMFILLFSVFCFKLIRFESVNANSFIKLSVNPDISDENKIWGIL